MNGTNSDEIKLLTRSKDHNSKKQLILLILCLLISNTSLYWWLTANTPTAVLIEEANVLVQIPASKNLLGPAIGKKMAISITNHLNQLLVTRGFLHPSGEAGMDIIEVPKEQVAAVLQQKNTLNIIPYGTYQANKTPTRKNIHEIIF